MPELSTKKKSFVKPWKMLVNKGNGTELAGYPSDAAEPLSAGAGVSRREAMIQILDYQMPGNRR